MMNITQQTKFARRRFPLDGALRIIPFGGLGEVGRNMTVIEYNDDILVLDMGFRFPEENMPGIDYIIPNVHYLEDKKDKIRALIISHGHYDHIGAIPYLIGKIGNPIIYTAPLTAGIIRKRSEDFPGHPKLKIIMVKDGDLVTLGSMTVEFFHVNHNIPDDLGVRFRTPVGTIISTSDFKIDPNPVHDKPIDLERLKKWGNEGVQLLLSDSTGAEEEGHSISESDIQQNLEYIFNQAKGRIIAATFASLLNRIQQLANISEKFGRKVIVVGYSMKTNIDIARELGYFKTKKGTVIDVKEMKHYRPHQITIICTGAQGEDNAALMRIATKEHRQIQLERGDTVIFSSSVIPGNERSVQGLKDTIYRQGAQVFHYRMMDIHAGGHGQREDLDLLIKVLRPKFFIPVHGNYSMLVRHTELARQNGVPEKNILIMDNGQIAKLTRDSLTLEKGTVPANYVMVDGLGIGDIGEVVLRDRQVLAEDGMFVVIAVIDSETGKVRGNPDIISRGFIYLRESKELLDQVRRRVKRIVEEATQDTKPINWAYVRDNIREKIGQFLYSRTERRPMVLPVVIEV